MRWSVNGTPARDHRAALDLLPWYVNGTLEGEELERLEVHLRSCDACRAEEAQQRRLAHVLRTSEELAFSPQRAFERLSARLDAEAVLPRRGPAGRLRHAFQGLASPVRWALVAQLVLIVALAAALVRDVRQPLEFHTLSTVVETRPAAAPRLRVVFGAAAVEADIRALLVASGLEVIAGPSRFGVYTLELDGADVDAVLDRLRSSGLVVFVEPVVAAGDPRP